MNAITLQEKLIADANDIVRDMLNGKTPLLELARQGASTATEHAAKNGQREIVLVNRTSQGTVYDASPWPAAHK